MAMNQASNDYATAPAKRGLDDEYARTWILACWNESYFAKRNRMLLNRDNFSQYQLEHSFDHKKEGQSREVLSKVRNAVESSKSFFQQALADLDDWFRITMLNQADDGTGAPITPDEMKQMLKYMLKRAKYYTHVGNQVQLGLLGSLSISEVGGELVSKPRFTTKKEGKGSRYRKVVEVDDSNKVWELRFYDVRQEDYYPDPNTGHMYHIRESMVDMHVVRALATGENAIYDKEAVERLQPWGQDDLQEFKRARETGQNQYIPLIRPRIKITEFWGTIVDNTNGEIMAENVVCTLANRSEVIRPPTANPLWHQKSPINAAAMIEVAESPWGIALMDAGTKHTRALTELFNLMLDSAFKAVYGVNQIRTDVLDDPSQVTDGLRWGVDLKVNSSLPVGAKVAEPVVTGDIPAPVIEMFNLLNQEALTSMKTNDMRMGAQPMGQVKATQVVAAENSITSEFTGMAKNFEENKIQPELELACWTICQNWDLIDKEVFISLYGKERGEELHQLEPQDVFVNTVNGMKFEVFGISLALRRQADFRKWTTLLQVIAGSPMLMEAFVKKYSFEKLLGEIMTAIDLDKAKIQVDSPVSGAGQGQSMSPMAQPGAAGPGPTPMSNVPMAAGQPSGNPLVQAFSGQGNAMNMPSSQAIR